MHSFYSTDVYNTPTYSLMHRQGDPVKIYTPNKDCQFARETFRHPLPIANERDFNLCIQMIDQIQSGAIRPQYLLTKQIKCTSFEHSGICNDLCHIGLETLKAPDGAPLYSLERNYERAALETWLTSEYDFQIIDKEYRVYKLRSDLPPF